jgi:CBS domain-containing protein
MRIQVKDFMSTPVTTALGKTSVGEIKALMQEKGIHAIPIVWPAEDGVDNETTIRGIVTATDVIKDVDSSTPIEQVMAEANVQVIHIDSSVQAAAKMMLRHRVHHIVVMDDGRIEGIISSLDFVKLVAEQALA